MENNVINIKKVKSDIIVGFIKRIIKTSSLLLDERDMFSDHISYEKDDLLIVNNHDNPISNKQREVESLVTGVVISYFHAITRSCNFIEHHKYMKEKYINDKERIGYDMHILFKEGCLKNNFILLNERYYRLVDKEIIIPSFATIDCYDIESDFHYEIVPYIENKKNYKKQISNCYNSIDEYFVCNVESFDRDYFLSNESDLIFHSSYESILKELSKKEFYCEIFKDIIETGLFDEVFKYLQTDKDNFITSLSSCDNDINGLLNVKIYSYLEKKEIAEAFEWKFTDNDVVESEEVDKIKFKRKRL